jgi:ribosomal protein S18 acetylase RimI-like enzyme
MGSLSFQTIDLAQHADVCVEFRRDSYICSFGSDQAFFEGGGVEAYLEWLRDGIARHPKGHVHVWNGSSIIGQMEMRIRTNDPPTGYVNLFYLVPAARGTTAAGELQEYATEFMREGAVQLAHLSVSPTNLRAMAYYKKHSWRALGPRPNDTTVHLMELAIPAKS